LVRTNLKFYYVTAILDSLCKEFLNMNVSAILYLMNYEKYGRSTASAQYFLQLAGYLGIPVIAWNADNSGLERVIIIFGYVVKYE
jgi:glutamate receptor ionotropic, NMDA 2B